MKQIRNYIKSKVGSNVVIVSLQNRGKEEKYEGVIDTTYNNVFVIRDKFGGCKCFSYVDILIGNIRVYI